MKIFKNSNKNNVISLLNFRLRKKKLLKLSVRIFYAQIILQIVFNILGTHLGFIIFLLVRAIFAPLFVFQ